MMGPRHLLTMGLAWAGLLFFPAPSIGQAESDLQAWARGHLSKLQEDEDSLPSTPAVRLERIRAMYFLGVEEGQWAKRAQDSLAALKPALIAESDLDIAHSAYRGALEVVRAKHARFPPNKIKHLNRGSEILDELVARSPENLEVRYLRLASYRFLPFFLSRDDEVKEDLAILSRLLPDHREAFSPTMYAGVAQFVLDQGEDVDAGDRRRLENALQESSRANPFPGGDSDREMRP